MTAYPLHILYVEDESALAEIVRESLESRGFRVSHHLSGLAAIDAFFASRPDIVLLDVMLPDVDGFAFARTIRAKDLSIPILFLTSKSLPQDVVTGFESGGNDYLKKPFSMQELVVRIQALTNRNRTLYQEKADDGAALSIGADYIFHYRRALLEYKGGNIALTAREAELMRLFVVNSNQVIDRKTILLHIWGDDGFFTGRSLDVFITRLRKYLRHDPAIRIMNIRGIGYKLIS